MSQTSKKTSVSVSKKTSHSKKNAIFFKLLPFIKFEANNQHLDVRHMAYETLYDILRDEWDIFLLMM